MMDKEENLSALIDEEKLTYFPAMKIVCLVFAIICTIYILINLIQREPLLAGLNGGIGLIMFFSFFTIIRFETLKVATPIMLLMLTVLTVYYIICGGHEGFGITWVLLIPFISAYCIHTKLAIWYLSFIALILVGAFYTPLFHYCYQYTESVQIRLPMIYIAEAAICLLMKRNMALSEKLKDKLLSQNIQYKNKAEAASKAKSDFLANMSHEIRTPINAILGNDELILRESKETDIQDYAKNIKSSSKALLALINDILDFSKIESGKLNILPVEYNLASLLTDVHNMVVMRAEEKGLTLKTQVEKIAPSALLGDEVRIRQICVNLLTNAVKYTKTGGVTMNVYTSLGQKEMMNLIIEVQDTGIGISECNQKYLFDSFCRIDEKQNRNIEGSGLGLAITKQLVDLMDGTIQVQSQLGHGSTFKVVLPQKIVSASPIGEFTATSHDEHPQYKEQFHAPDARVLVVDDVSMNLKVFSGLLKKTQIQVDTAISGEECLKKISEREYDIIFLDHMMPNMDGIETFRAMQALSTFNSKTPVIMLTANALEGAREQYMSEGFTNYLSKPIHADQLEKMILNYLPKELIKA